MHVGVVEKVVVVYLASSGLTPAPAAVAEMNKVLDPQDSLHRHQRRKRSMVIRPTLEEGESADSVPGRSRAGGEPQDPK